MRPFRLLERSPFRLLERSLMGAGCAMILLYAGSQTHSFLLSRLGLLSFHSKFPNSSAVQATNTRSADSGIDFRLWSVQRIQAYKDALATKFEAPIAVLSIPRIGIEVPVFNGTDAITLNRGAGRIAGTAGLGEAGNMGIAAHRDGFFRKLKDIQI